MVGTSWHLGRRWLLLAGVILAAGCAAAEPAGNTVPGLAPSLTWRIDRTPETLVLALDDARAVYRVEGATLRGPGGQAIAAREISREITQRRGGHGGGPYGGVGVGTGGSRSGVGIGLSFPIFRSAGSSGDERHTEATFTVPDGGRDLPGWPQDWVVDVALTDNTGAASTATIPVAGRG